MSEPTPQLSTKNKKNSSGIGAFRDTIEVPDFKKNQTISYDEEEQRGLFNKMFQKFGNFFKGESPSQGMMPQDTLLTERLHTSKSNSAKPPLHIGEKRTSYQPDGTEIQLRSKKRD